MTNDKYQLTNGKLNSASISRSTDRTKRFPACPPLAHARGSDTNSAYAAFLLRQAKTWPQASASRLARGICPNLLRLYPVFLAPATQRRDCSMRRPGAG